MILIPLLGPNRGLLRKNSKALICHYQEDESSDLVGLFRTLSVSTQAFNGHGNHGWDDLSGPCVCQDICNAWKPSGCRRLVEWEETRNQGWRCLAGQPASACAEHAHCEAGSFCTCDEGYEGDPLVLCESQQNEYFCFNLQELDASEHEAAACLLGGHAASIQNQAENDIVYDLIETVYNGVRDNYPDGFGHVHLSGRHDVADQTGKWSDNSGSFWTRGNCIAEGRSIDGVYENFYCNKSTLGWQQPDSGGTDACLDMFHILNVNIPYAGHWNDLNCRREYPGVYRFPAGSYDEATLVNGYTCVRVST